MYNSSAEDSFPEEKLIQLMKDGSVPVLASKILCFTDDDYNQMRNDKDKDSVDNDDYDLQN